MMRSRWKDTLMTISWEAALHMSYTQSAATEAPVMAWC